MIYIIFQKIFDFMRNKSKKVYFCTVKTTNGSVVQFG